MLALRAALAVAVLTPAVSLAQDRPLVEVGTRLGVTIEHAGGTTLTHFGAPGAGILGQPTIYATIFATPQMFIEPDLAFNLASGGGSTVTTFGLAGNLGYFFQKKGASGAPYVAANVGLQALSGGGTSHTEAAIGGRVGYRVVVQKNFAVRFEGGYRRWLGSSHENEITIGVGLGAIIHSKK